MGAARRTALWSVAAALALVVLKLGAGFATNSLGLVSEGLHSGTDLVAALLTFFALGVSGRPADSSHPWGHGKAEHLSALGECIILAGASVFIAGAAIRRLADSDHPKVDATWWAFAVLGLVIAIDVARTVASTRAARRHGSPALMSNALHFGGDLAGTLAVLVGLLLVRTGYPKADAIAALFVAALVLTAAARLAAANVNVLMDRRSVKAEESARQAIAALGPDIQLERLRIREAAGNHFADVVISVSPSAALAEGHAAADAVEGAVRDALPGSDIVVHVEPGRPATTMTERVLAAALAVPGVREIHNVQIVESGDGSDVSLHLKLPATERLETAHEVADQVEAAILAAVPQIGHVVTHLEPLSEAVAVESVASEERPDLAATVSTLVTRTPGAIATGIRFVQSDDGIVAFLTIELAGNPTLDEAHAIGGEIRSRLRRECDEVHDVLVHTEPASARG